MKLTAGQVWDATRALAQIINRPRVIPQTAKYRISRMHTGLIKEHELIEAERVKIIQELGSEQFADEAKTQSMGWRVPENTPAFEAYLARWAAIRAQELEVNVQPLSLYALGDDAAGLEANEFSMLGDLIVDDAVQLTAQV